MLFNPFPGVMALTFILATLLIAEGLLRSVLGVRLRKSEGWIWFLVGGLASIVLGVVLLTGWPATALWSLGLLLGVNFVFSGAMNMALALDCRKRTGHSSRKRRRRAGAHGHLNYFARRR